MRTEQVLPDSGTATIDPHGEIIADAPFSCRIVYTAGRHGIATGGGLCLVVPYGFAPPQHTYPTAEGYLSCRAPSGDTDISIHGHDPAGPGSNEETWGVKAYLLVERGDVASGESIEIYYGQNPHLEGLTNIGSRARRFEGEAEFTLLVDPDGHRSAQVGGFYLLDTPQPKVTITGGPAATLQPIVPSTVGTDESCTIHIGARDRFGNIAWPREMTVDVFDNARHVGTATIGRSGEGELEVATSKAGGPRRLVVKNSDAAPGPAPSDRDVRQRRLEQSAAEQQSADRGAAPFAPRLSVARSNPMLETQPGEPRIFWGDLHVMTGISAGLSRPEAALRYARDHGHLDFCAVTDGDSAANHYFSDDEWRETRSAVEGLYRPEAFVTMLASEYHERGVAGDKNIYYRDTDAPLSRWCDLPGPQPEALWQALEGRQALTVPHHTVSGSARMHPWDHHHVEFQRLVEIYSIWGSSEGEGCGRPNFWENNWDNSVRHALAKGYRLGFIASGDSHDGRPGNSRWMRLMEQHRGGLAAVFAFELTREAVFDALYHRRCYGTTGERILLTVSCNDSPMGTEITGKPHRRRRSIRVEVSGTRNSKCAPWCGSKANASIDGSLIVGHIWNSRPFLTEI